MTRHTITGRNSWQRGRTGYRHESKQWARFERPDGEPSIAFGTFIIGLPFVLAVFFIVGFRL